MKATRGSNEAAGFLCPEPGCRSVRAEILDMAIDGEWLELRCLSCEWVFRVEPFDGPEENGG